MLRMSENNFGNYVIQSMLDHCDHNLKAEILEELRVRPELMIALTKAKFGS